MIDESSEIETKITQYFNQALSKIYGNNQPDFYYSSRLFPRASFPSLFAKQEDGTLGLKESRLFDHFHLKTNVYHHYPSSTTTGPLKDRPR